MKDGKRSTGHGINIKKTLSYKITPEGYFHCAFLHCFICFFLTLKKYYFLTITFLETTLKLKKNPLKSKLNFDTLNFENGFVGQNKRKMLTETSHSENMARFLCSPLMLPNNFLNFNMIEFQISPLNLSPFLVWV